MFTMFFSVVLNFHNFPNTTIKIISEIHTFKICNNFHLVHLGSKGQFEFVSQKFYKLFCPKKKKRKEPRIKP